MNANRTNVLRTLSMLSLVAASLGIAACAHRGPAEKAGKKVDDAIEEVKDKAEDVGDKLEDAVDNLD